MHRQRHRSEADSDREHLLDQCCRRCNARLSVAFPAAVFTPLEHPVQLRMQQTGEPAHNAFCQWRRKQDSAPLSIRKSIVINDGLDTDTCLLFQRVITKARLYEMRLTKKRRALRGNLTPPAPVAKKCSRNTPGRHQKLTHQLLGLSSTDRETTRRTLDYASNSGQPGDAALDVRRNIHSSPLRIIQRGACGLDPARKSKAAPTPSITGRNSAAVSHNPTLLLRTSQSDKQQPGTRIANSFCYLFIFGCFQRTERRRHRECNLQFRISAPHLRD